MKNLAILEYIFMFDPSATWAHLYEFEKSLSDFFAAHGMDATIVKTVDGATGRRILMITRIQTPLPAEPKPIGRPKQPGSQFKDLAKRNLRQPAYKFQGKDFKKETK